MKTLLLYFQNKDNNLYVFSSIAVYLDTENLLHFTNYTISENFT